MKLTIVFIIALAAATAPEGRAAGDRVILAADSSRTLQERWNGARGKERWIGFAIERRMGTGSFIGTYWSDEAKNRP